MFIQARIQHQQQRVGGGGGGGGGGKLRYVAAIAPEQDFFFFFFNLTPSATPLNTTRPRLDGTNKGGETGPGDSRWESR